MISLKSMRDCDPRDYQLMTLTSMLAYGLFWLKFDLNKFWLAAIIGTAIGAQWVATRVWKLRCFEWRSAAISGMSLAILMRCHSLPLSLGLACVAIFSKFLIRFRGKHVFNPTNFALVLGIVATGQVWITPTQWGNGAVLAFLIICMGSFVVNRATRSDVSYSFLVTYALIILSYTAWAGLPMTAALQRLQTGSLLVFIFFMISDPKTTPNSHWARIAFAVVVASFGAYLQLAHQVQAGLLISLACLSVMVPLLDWLLPGVKYEWQAPCAADSTPQTVSNA